MKGIINLNKPSGISSAAAVSKVKRVLGVKSVGHMGTLDPLASGVLLVGVGKACRLFDFFLQKDKKYTAVFEFGTETDTLDCTGETTRSGGRIPTLNEICECLPVFFGKIQQIPPQYSAKSVNGQRAYKIARQGGTLVLKASEVEIFNLKLTRQISKTSFEFDIHCSSGTYIRSLARDIAYALNTFAIMTSLVRTTCGNFALEKAVTLDFLEEKKGACLTKIEDTLTDLPYLNLDEAYHKQLANGIKLKFEDCYNDPANKNYGNFTNIITDCSTKKTSTNISTSNSKEQFLLFCGGELFGIAKLDSEGFVRISSYLKD